MVFAYSFAGVCLAKRSEHVRRSLRALGVVYFLLQVSRLVLSYGVLQ